MSTLKLALNEKGYVGSYQGCMECGQVLPRVKITAHGRKFCSSGCAVKFSSRRYFARKAAKG